MRKCRSDRRAEMVIIDYKLAVCANWLAPALIGWPLRQMANLAPESTGLLAYMAPAPYGWPCAWLTWPLRLALAPTGWALHQLVGPCANWLAPAPTGWPLQTV